MGLEQFNFGEIAVFKMVCRKINARSFRHYVDDDLNDSLLLKCVTRMLVTFKVTKN